MTRAKVNNLASRSHNFRGNFCHISSPQKIYHKLSPGKDFLPLVMPSCSPPYPRKRHASNSPTPSSPGAITGGLPWVASLVQRGLRTRIPHSQAQQPHRRNSHTDETQQRSQQNNTPKALGTWIRQSPTSPGFGEQILTQGNISTKLLVPLQSEFVPQKQLGVVQHTYQLQIATPNTNNMFLLPHLHTSCTQT